MYGGLFWNRRRMGRESVRRKLNGHVYVRDFDEEEKEDCMLEGVRG